MKLFLYFGKRNPPKNLYISGNEIFLYFLKNAFLILQERYIQKTPAYLEPEAYSEPWYIQNHSLFRTLAYLGLEAYLEPSITFIIFWGFLMFYQIFLSPQVKRCAIITYKHVMYELPAMPNPPPRTASPPLGGPLCPHKKKKRKICKY